MLPRPSRRPGRPTRLALLTVLAALTVSVAANGLSYKSDWFPRQISVLQQDDRPADCPPCFNCNLEQFACQQFGNCSAATGQCACPTGFGGMDCAQPLCGSPAKGTDRFARPADSGTCDCDDGWSGINCNVCKTNEACNALTPENQGGVCFLGAPVKQNFQQCAVVNKKIVEMLDPRKPDVTLSCNGEDKTCNFQFWVDQVEGFYCKLGNCTYDFNIDGKTNSTKYTCNDISCKCIPGRFLCGENGGLDFAEFLTKSIKGPASFVSTQTQGGSPNDGAKFHEPALDGILSNVFGDDAILLDCSGGECLYSSEVPGMEKPVKKINTSLIAGVIAGCALFIVVVIFIVWFLSRRRLKRYGPLHLMDPDDESAKLLADHRPTAFCFDNVSYTLNGRQILSNVQGAVRPGEICAIMGASGAGKTTFLDILARKNKKGTSGGNFYINGEQISNSDFRNVSGFVDQDDTMLPTLTVHETILDSALLRLPKNMGLAAKEQRVEDVEKQLGIFHIRDQLIGSEEGSGRGISGGEKRRVSIACELVTSPSILFLDEPTSGLDAYNAYNVVECMVNLVKTYNRTVIFTIHQPRSNIVALFDGLILLAKGRAVYSGPFSQCQAYFDSIGYSCPPGFNIADYVVDLTMHAGADKSHDADANGNGADRPSSLLGAKSVKSASNLDLPHALQQAPARGRAHRSLSIKQQQDELLFGRPSLERAAERAERASRDTNRTSLGSLVRNSWDNAGTGLGLATGADTGAAGGGTHGQDSPQSVKTDDDPLDTTGQSWQLSRRAAGNDDPHALPPEAPATGTDLDYLISSYNDSNVSQALQDETRDAVFSASSANHGSNGNGTADKLPRVKGYKKVGIAGQFRILSVRVWRNLYRNPMLLLTHYAISIVLAVLLGGLYFGLTDDLPGFQNRLGLLFFILALFGFSTLTSLTVFASERLLFTRERAKGYYYPISYFAAKVIFDVIPLRLIPPIILGVIVYPMTGLIPAAKEFFTFMMFLVLFNFAAAAVCLFIGIVFKNAGVANLIGSLTMLFSLLFAGFLLNHDKIPGFVVWLQNLSIFHYAFEGLIVNECRTLSLTDHKYGLDIEVPGAAIVSSFGFNIKGVAMDAVGLAAFTAGFMLIAYLSMHILLVERR